VELPTTISSEDEEVGGRLVPVSPVPEPNTGVVEFQGPRDEDVTLDDDAFDPVVTVDNVLRLERDCELLVAPELVAVIVSQIV